MGHIRSSSELKIVVYLFKIPKIESSIFDSKLVVRFVQNYEYWTHDIIKFQSMSSQEDHQDEVEAPEVPENEVMEEEPAQKEDDEEEQ